MLLHASSVSVNGKAVLLAGPSGIGKSDLALRLIDGGAQLIADDQTLLQCAGDRLVASAPPSIAGLIEIRHIGLMKMPCAAAAPVALYVECAGINEKIERLPAKDFVFFLDRRVQRLRLPALAVSTPSKIRAFLTYAVIDD